MRISKRFLRARVNPNPPIGFSDERISAHGGLELFGRFLRAIDLAGRLHRDFAGLRVDGDYGARSLVLCVIGLLLVGGRRIAHLRDLEKTLKQER